MHVHGQEFFLINQRGLRLQCGCSKGPTLLPHLIAFAVNVATGFARNGVFSVMLMIRSP